MNTVKLYTAETQDNAIVTRKHLEECKSTSLRVAMRTATRRQVWAGTELLVVAVYSRDGEEIHSEIAASKRGGKWTVKSDL